MQTWNEALSQLTKTNFIKHNKKCCFFIISKICRSFRLQITNMNKYPKIAEYSVQPLKKSSIFLIWALFWHFLFNSNFLKHFLHRQKQIRLQWKFCHKSDRNAYMDPCWVYVDFCIYIFFFVLYVLLTCISLSIVHCCLVLICECLKDLFFYISFLFCCCICIFGNTLNTWNKSVSFKFWFLFIVQFIGIVLYHSLW